jgi:hypothetical protein
MALTRIRVLNQQSTYNVDRLNANTLVVGGNNITGAGGGIVISSVVYLAANGTPLIANAAPTTGNSVIKIIGSGFAANANVFLNGTLQPSANVTFVDSTELRLNMPPLASNTYSLFTFNAAGAGAIFYSGVRFDPYPIWTTGEYTAVGNVSTQLLVTGYGSGSITFSLASGNTLPSGLSLAANGLLSGTTTANTFNFYVNATDSENEITTQQISLTVVFPDTYFPYTTLLLSASSQTANNVSTETFTDSSNNNLSITATGTPYQGSFTPFPTTGTWSNYFNGSTDFLSLPSSSTTNFSGVDWTIELWFYPTSVPPANVTNLIQSGQGTNNWHPYIGIGININRTLQIVINAVSAATTETFNLNSWNHGALVRSGGVVKFYLNGIATSISTTSDISNTNLSWFFGKVDNAAGGGGYLYYFNGYLSNIRFVKGTALYTSTFTPSTTPLTAIANTSLLTCQSNRFIDNSTNAYTVTPTGSIKVRRFNPFGSNGLSYSPSTNGGSIYFDVSSYLTTTNNGQYALGTNDFTIESWVNWNGGGSNPTFLANWTGSFSTNAWSLHSSHASYVNKPVFYCYNYNSSNPLLESASAYLADSSWHHIAVTRNGSTFRLFVDGVIKATATFSGSVDNGSSHLLYAPSPTNTWDGYISNLRIIKGTAIYTSGFTPPTVPFVPITNTSLLLLGANSKYYDSTKINNIKNVGGVAVRTDIKNYGTNSWYFNGSSYLTMLNNPIFNFPKDFTIELWLYNVSTVFYGNIFSTTANYVTSNSLRLTTGPSNNTFSVGIGNSGSVTGNTTFSNNTWVHVALVRSGTSLTIYQNGINIGTVTDSTAFISDTMVIGTVSAAGGGAGGPYNLNAYIQDFRVTNGIARYTTTFVPPTAPVPAT